MAAIVEFVPHKLNKVAFSKLYFTLDVIGEPLLIEM
jgi:hypothetical protein